MAKPDESDPLGELRRVQKRLNEMFEGALARSDFEAGPGLDSWTPVSDAYQTADALILLLELPGLRLDQIQVRLDGDDLVVEGERRMDREQPGERYHRVERSFGRFSRRFPLPSTVERGNVQATYRNGLLRVELPTGGRPRPESIRVDVS